TLDLQALEQAADVAGIGAAVVGPDQKDQPMHADDPAREAGRRIDSTHRGGIHRGAGAARVLCPADVFDDRPMPRQLATRTDPVGRRGCTGARLVVAELTGQVIGPRPLLAVLPQRNPHFLLLAHGWRGLQIDARSIARRTRPDPIRPQPTRADLT